MDQELEGFGEIQEFRSKAVNYALVAFSILLVPALIASLYFLKT